MVVLTNDATVDRVARNATALKVIPCTFQTGKSPVFAIHVSSEAAFRQIVEVYSFKTKYGRKNTISLVSVAARRKV